MSEASEFLLVTRELGIHLLVSDWSNWHHIGDVPTRAEIEATTCDTSRPSCYVELPPYANIPYNHGDDDGELTSNVAAAMPCQTADASSKPVGVDSWLMDSGTQLDLVD